MNKYSPEIATLRMDIEQSVKRKIRTPYDFEFLAGVIWERLHENLSPTTLKRLWGYIDERAQWVIPAQYDSAAGFSDCLALVEKDGKLMYIDHSGAVVWEER